MFTHVFFSILKHEVHMQHFPPLSLSFYELQNELLNNNKQSQLDENQDSVYLRLLFHLETILTMMMDITIPVNIVTAPTPIPTPNPMIYAS